MSRKNNDYTTLKELKDDYEVENGKSLFDYFYAFLIHTTLYVIFGVAGLFFLLPLGVSPLLAMNLYIPIYLIHKYFYIFNTPISRLLKIKIF